MREAYIPTSRGDFGTGCVPHNIEGEGEKTKDLEQRGIDPRTSRMLSERSTT